ncbi:MAG: hypothetical protein M3N42_05570 [Cyanobacteriota bacterium]|nr:hypothetical protein [Cyanobacteriota bacterium]
MMLNKLTAVTQKFSPNQRQIIGNMAWLFAEKIVKMGLGLAEFYPQTRKIFLHQTKVIILFGLSGG